MWIALHRDYYHLNGFALSLIYRVAHPHDEPLLAVALLAPSDSSVLVETPVLTVKSIGEFV